MIEDRAARPITTRLHSALETRDTTEASGITSRFYDRIMEEVHERVNAHIIWFVSRYPGGVPDMARNERLRRCLQEARDHDSPVVTGVAGYMVLDNRIDNTIASPRRSTVRSNARPPATMTSRSTTDSGTNWVASARPCGADRQHQDGAPGHHVDRLAAVVQLQ